MRSERCSNRYWLWGSSRLPAVPTHLGILADRVEQTNVTLITSDCNTTRLGGSGGGKVILGCILLELRLDQLVALYTGIDSEETIVGCCSGYQVSVLYC